MAEWLETGLVVGVIALACVYSYSVLRLFHSIRKCPDCGRIMQKVKYTSQDQMGQTAIHRECPFCQSTQFRSLHRDNKLTLHP